MCVFLKQHFMSTLERNYEKQKNEQMMQTSYLHGAAAAAMVVAKKENCLQPRQHRWIFGSSAKIFWDDDASPFTIYSQQQQDFTLVVQCMNRM